MPYRIAGIDVHKKMLAVVVADVEIDGDFRFEHQKIGTTPIAPSGGSPGGTTGSWPPRRPRGSTSTP